MNNQQIPSTSPQPQPQSQPQIVSLPGAGQLLKKALQVYKSRFWVFLGITVIPLLVSLFLFGSATILRILKAPWIFFIAIIVGYLALIIISFWSQASLLYAIKEREQKIGIRESFAKGWHKILSYFWISVLSGFIIMGGFLLFIIPGIIFAIWFSLALYILVSEDIKGMNALFRSKQLVKRYWGKVFWRFLVMGFVVAIIIVPIAFISEIFNISFVTNILSILITPFFVTFAFLIYENLKQLKGAVPFDPPKRKTKIGFIAIGVIGTLLIPAIFYLMVLVSIKGASEKAKDAGIMANMSQIRAAAEMIYFDEGDSYSKVSCAHPEVAPACDYIVNQLNERPIIYFSDNAYCGYVRLFSGEYYCVDSKFGGGKTNIYPGEAGYCNGITFICP